MDKLKLNIRKLIYSYEAWVADNPETVGDLETTSKWVSYFIAGRISNSNVVSELVYSLSNLLVLYNDRILEESRCNKTRAAAIKRSGLASLAENGPSSPGIIINEQPQQQKDKKSMVYRVKLILTTLEYCEVFIEISARRLFGPKGKWLFIVALQAMKAVGRYFILKHSTEEVVMSPALPNLNRRQFVGMMKAKSPGGGAIVNNNGKHGKYIQQEQLPQPEEHKFTFHLKRSGRVMRKVEGAPPLQLRDFNFLRAIEEERGPGLGNSNPPRSSLLTAKGLLHAEYVYIAKPLIHLAAMGAFGQKRWKQYLIALSVDVLSLHLYYKNRHLMSKQQRVETSRRCMNLLLYLMRSPFYERYTQRRLDGILEFIAENVPLLRIMAGPLRDYIPHWQSTYFYLWST